jgi:hypothetical protein
VFAWKDKEKHTQDRPETGRIVLSRWTSNLRVGGSNPSGRTRSELLEHLECFVAIQCGAAPGGSTARPLVLGVPVASRAVELLAAMLCDTAAARDGLLTIVNGGIDYWGPPEYPAALG